MLTVKTVADRLGVQVHAVLKWLHTGELAGVNLARDAAGERPRWRIPEPALSSFLAARTRQPPLLRAPRRRRPVETLEFYK